MGKKQPSYYRARVKAIEEAIAYENSLPESREREMRIAYLRNGHVPDRFLQTNHHNYAINTGVVGEMIDRRIGHSNIHYWLTIDQLTDRYEIKSTENNDDLTKPLTDPELAQYDTWFQVHPEKVCGRQVGGTGYSFPIKTIGTKEDIMHAIDATLTKGKSKKEIPFDEPDELELLELEAEALVLLQKQALAIT